MHVLITGGAGFVGSHVGVGQSMYEVEHYVSASTTSARRCCSRR
jgi:UDP-glucose 4-epimerase